MNPSARNTASSRVDLGAVGRGSTSPSSPSCFSKSFGARYWIGTGCTKSRPRRLRDLGRDRRDARIPTASGTTTASRSTATNTAPAGDRRAPRRTPRWPIEPQRASRSAGARRRPRRTTSPYIRVSSTRRSALLSRSRRRRRPARLRPLGSMPPCSTPSTPPSPGTRGRSCGELRDEGPLATVAGGLRYITRYAEARAVLRDTETFSNASGMKAPGVEVPLEDRLLGELDPPRHTAVRRVMVTAMTPKVVHAAEPFIASTAAGAARRARRPTGFDLVASYTAVLPNRVTMYLLGFDPADADQLARWAKELMESTFPALNRTERGVGFAAAFPEFAGYIDARIAERTAQLAAGEDARRRARPPDPARGRRRTAPAAAAARARAQPHHRRAHHDEPAARQSALRAPARARRSRPRCAPIARCSTTAIEESLRLTPPILFLARGCVRDTEIGGCPVHAGERVVDRRRVGESRRARLRATPTSSTSIAPTPISTSRSATARTCARARRSPARSRASASTRCSTTSRRASCSSNPASCSSRSRRTSSTAPAASPSCARPSR